MTTSALVVLSGGQDSTTCLFWAKLHYKHVYAVTFDYGQRHSREIESARMVALMAGVLRHDVVGIPDCLVSTSPLTSPTADLEKYDNFEQMDKVIGDRVEKTFVPMRNTLFLTIAANRAVAYGCTAIVAGVCQEDNANYPDCREDYLMSMERTINKSLGHMQTADPGWVFLNAPLLHLSKANTVTLAKNLPGCWEALAYTHTSYDGKYPPIDPNHANVLRAHGFETAGLPDPLVLRAHKDGLMKLPATANYDDERSEADLQRVIHERALQARRDSE